MIGSPGNEGINLNINGKQQKVAAGDVIRVSPDASTACQVQLQSFDMFRLCWPHHAPRRITVDENMKKPVASQGQSASELISKRIAELGDWRGKSLGRMRKLIKAADPDAVEEWKWRGTPVWSHDGIICTGESYKKVVKLTFAKARL